jgi:hypothetical protein
MTVDDLRKALVGVPGNLKVEMTFPGDEFPVTCVTQDKTYLRVCSYSDDVSVAETVLHNDAAA